jgi:hypothetical protein
MKIERKTKMADNNAAMSRELLREAVSQLDTIGTVKASGIARRLCNALATAALGTQEGKRIAGANVAEINMVIALLENRDAKWLDGYSRATTKPDGDNAIREIVADIRRAITLLRELASQARTIEALRAELATAQASERERAASLCDAFKANCEGGGFANVFGAHHAAEFLARKIRALSPIPNQEKPDNKS